MGRRVAASTYRGRILNPEPPRVALSSRRGAFERQVEVEAGNTAMTHWREYHDRSGCLAIFLVSAATMTVVIDILHRRCAPSLGMQSRAGC